MAIINATNESVKKTRTDIYSGTAEIVDVGAVDARWTKDLSEEDAASAFDLEIRVDVPDIGEQTIYIPVTARVPAFVKDGRTEAQVALDDLTRQGLVTGGDISTVLAAKGKKCQVLIYDETSAKGTFRRARLSTAKPKLSNADLLKRMQRLTANSASAPKSNPFA